MPPDDFLGNSLFMRQQTCFLLASLFFLESFYFTRKLHELLSSLSWKWISEVERRRNKSERGWEKSEISDTNLFSFHWQSCFLLEKRVLSLRLTWSEFFSCEIGSWNPLSSVCFFVVWESWWRTKRLPSTPRLLSRKGKEVKIEWVKYQYKYTSEVRQFRRFFIVGSKWGHYSLVKSNTSLSLEEDSLPLSCCQMISSHRNSVKTCFTRITLNSVPVVNNLSLPLSSLPSLSSTLLYGSKHTQVKK